MKKSIILAALLFLIPLVAHADTYEEDHDSYLQDRHWAINGAEARVGILVRGNATAVQQMADVAKALSDAVDRLDVGIIGMATAEQCQYGVVVPDHYLNNGMVGYIVACFGVSELTVSGSAGGINTCQANPYFGCESAHYAATRMSMRAANPSDGTVAHELQHAALGLCDSYASSCETPVGNIGICPTAQAIAYANDRYDHDDQISTSAPVGSWIVQGTHSCGGGGTPTLTPTVTPTVEPTPTHEPTPRCPPGWARRGKC